MENQHRQIKGYRELSQAEIDLMNRIKQHGPALQDLIRDIEAHVSVQSIDAIRAKDDGDSTDFDRLNAAEARRWLAIGRTDLQQGLMALTRAVAQPTFF